MTKEQLAALAAWESATAQNLNPLLTSDESEAFWNTVVELREHGNVETFAAAAREALPVRLVTVREAFARDLAALTALFPAAAAKE